MKTKPSSSFAGTWLLPLDDSLIGSTGHDDPDPERLLAQRGGCGVIGISRLPDVEGDKPEKKNSRPIGSATIHIDIAEGRTAEGKLTCMSQSTGPANLPRPAYEEDR